MGESFTRVDFHLHSHCSDGFLAPEALAEKVAASGIRYAALADHDTTEGVERFRAASDRQGIATVSGVEITVGADDEALHLLAYGFDPQDRALQALLETRRARRPEGAFVSRTMSRLRGTARARKGRKAPAAERVRSWAEEMKRVVATVHAAHGRAFLAHPLSLTQDPEELDRLLVAFQAAGLDGVEALHGEYNKVEQQTLLRLADRRGLLVSAGSDFHDPERMDAVRPGVDIPTGRWKTFRDAVLSSERPRSGERAGSGPREHTRPLRLRRFLLHILFPALLTIVLFAGALFAVILPAFEENLLERKREMIRELTNSAWSVLAQYERLEREGVLTPGEARRNAADRIEAMRYGREGKDYFWITDEHPRMIMHPYRKDLEGEDLSDYRDPNGVALFRKFVDVVREKGEGYVDYVWQWKDDPGRLASKESYVKGFEPWGWVIGTGIYLEDVRREINRMVSRVLNVSAFIAVVILLLLSYIAWESLRFERQRREAVEELDESHEKYRALVEAATEGTFLVLGETCAYSNRTAREMLGYDEEEMALLDVYDLLPAAEEDRDEGCERLVALLEGHEAPARFDTRLRRKDGSLHDVALSATRISVAGQEGLVLNARDISRHKRVEEALGVSHEKYRGLTEKLDIGVFRAAADEGMTFVEMNPAAVRVFGFTEGAGFRERRFLEHFLDAGEARHFRDTLRREGVVQKQALRIHKENGDVSIVSLSAALARDGAEEAEFCDGIIDDITERKKVEKEREDLIAELQTSLLFLNEPLRHCVEPALTCAMGDTVEDVARRMTRERRSAVAVVNEQGEAIGIVTDHDLRERVLVARRDFSRPVFEIMSAPVIAVTRNALVYEAILRMQENKVRHLAVRDQDGRIVGMARAEDLMRFERYSAAVLTRDIQKAGSVVEIAENYEKLPVLVQALTEGGARSRSAARVIATIADTIAGRLIELAARELGPPPCRFAFFALGSEGRGEQTLVTDQDNAICYEDATEGWAEGRPEETREYFRRLGERVCDDLNRIGYRFCRGELMAKNPKWNQPLSTWKEYFADWIRTADPQDMLEINKFFDFRCVYGDRDLIEDLRVHLRASLKGRAPFFQHFAQNALLSKPPIGLFGKIVVQSGGEKPRTFNIKDSMMLIVSFARLYALRHDVTETNTDDRINRLFEKNVLSETMRRETAQAYDYLMRMRLRHQALAISEGREPDNAIDPKQLSHIEESALKEVFSQISNIQTKIKSDFTGLV